MTKIDEFFDWQKNINSVKDSTTKDQRSKLEVANRWKPLINWNKPDISAYIGHMHEEQYKQSYIEMNKALLKKFFIWMGKEKFVDDLKVRVITQKLRRADILSPEDIDKLIEASPDNQWKALIALMFESGARISEILELQVKDIEETTQGMKIFIHAKKTGDDFRPCLCLLSGQYIRNHILYPRLKKDSKLFNMGKSTIQQNIKKIGKEAGIEKPVNPHAFRHASATYMVRKGYSEPIIRAKHGWTGDSKMIARYVSIDGNDVINATLEKEGQTPIVPHEHELVRAITPATPIEIADQTFEIRRLQEQQATMEKELQDSKEMKARMARLEEMILNSRNNMLDIIMKELNIKEEKLTDEIKLQTFIVD
jgi:site-specific recombinase XerD